MGVFLNTAAYGYQPMGSTFCTATSQTAGYTYYKAGSLIDGSIPQWTIRCLNSLTSSMLGSGNGIGAVFFSCNAQYSTASYGGAQSNSNVSTRSTNGAVRAYGMAAQTTAFSSESCYTDSYDNLSTGDYCSRLYATVYGSIVQKNNLLKNTTSFMSTWPTPTWGNQPYLNTCATYGIGAVSHQYVSCSNNTAFTSSLAETVCVRQYQLTSTGDTPFISNYYSSSCGTY